MYKYRAEEEESRSNSNTQVGTESRRRTGESVFGVETRDDPLIHVPRSYKGGVEGPTHSAVHTVYVHLP
jgi:hypothetical protein